MTIFNCYLCDSRHLLNLVSFTIKKPHNVILLGCQGNATVRNESVANVPAFVTESLILSLLGFEFIIKWSNIVLQGGVPRLC